MNPEKFSGLTEEGRGSASVSKLRRVWRAIQQSGEMTLPQDFEQNFGVEWAGNYKAVLAAMVLSEVLWIQRIYLHGSFAEGRVTEKSDIDLLVVSSSQDHRKHMRKFTGNSPFFSDLLEAHGLERGQKPGQLHIVPTSILDIYLQGHISDPGFEGFYRNAADPRTILLYEAEDYEKVAKSDLYLYERESLEEFESVIREPVIKK